MTPAHIVSIGILIGCAMVLGFSVLSIGLDRGQPGWIRLLACLAFFVALSVIVLIGMTVVSIGPARH